MNTTYLPLPESIPAADLRPGMFLHRVAQRPLSAVFSAPVDALVLDVIRKDNGQGPYMEVVLDPGPHAAASSLNLDPARPVRVMGA